MSEINPQTAPRPVERNFATTEINALDWLAPILLTVGLFFFQSLSVMLYFIGDYSGSPTWQAWAYPLGALVGFVLLFTLAPSPSKRARLQGFGLLAFGLILTVPQFWITMMPATSTYDVGFSVFMGFVSMGYSTFIYAVLISAWFILRGYPGFTFAWLVPLAPLTAVLQMIRVSAIVPGFYHQMSPLQMSLVDGLYLLMPFALVMYAALLTWPKFQRVAGMRGYKTNTAALVGFVFAFIQGIVAVILGHIALKQIRERRESGFGFAVGAITLGWAGVLLSMFVVGWIAMGIKAIQL